MRSDYARPVKEVKEVKEMKGPILLDLERRYKYPEFVWFWWGRMDLHFSKLL